MDKKFFLPLTAFVALTAVVVVWHQFFYATTQREILAMQLETRRLRGLEREITTLKARHDLTALLSAKENQLDAARIFLPTTPAQDKFIDELYRTAEFYRARLISVQAGEVTSAAAIQSQVVNVSLEADYVALLNFIRETLDGGRMVSLENFSVTGGDNVLSCELSFKIFAAPSSK